MKLSHSSGKGIVHTGNNIFTVFWLLGCSVCFSSCLKVRELGSARHTTLAVTRIRTWVVAATTRSTNHYTITASALTGFKAFGTSSVGLNRCLCFWIVLHMLAQIAVNQTSMRFSSVVVITLASHARGPGFDPQLNHKSFRLFMR